MVRGLKGHTSVTFEYVCSRPQPTLQYAEAWSLRRAVTLCYIILIQDMA